MIGQEIKYISQKFSGVCVEDILDLHNDIIVKYEDKDGQIKTVPIFQSYLERYFNNRPEELLINAVKEYIALDNIKIINIYKYPDRFYRFSDFDIKIIKKYEYRYASEYKNESKELIFVEIKNKKTGVIFKDWVRPGQIKSLFSLNNLICWETEGQELFFKGINSFE
ncbi:MAG: hypothetical protein ACTSU2_10440 [Promethearchaeota archaeon]